MIVDGLGVGSLPDYSKYNDEYTCTVDNISVIDELLTLKKLGLLKCCLKEENSNVKSRYFRGRTLTIFNDLDCGLNEIFGNKIFDKTLPIKDNMITLLERINIKCDFVTSRTQCEFVSKFAENDDIVFDELNKFLTNEEGVFIGEFYDFCKYGLCGDTNKMNSSILYFDKSLGEFLGKVKYNDIVILTGNFGINPSKIGISREYNPIFVYSKLLEGSKVLSTVQGNSRIAMTIVDLLNLYPNSESLIDYKEKQKIENYTSILKNELIASGFEKVLELKGKDKQNKGNKVARTTKIKSKKAIKN